MKELKNLEAIRELLASHPNIPAFIMLSKNGNQTTGKQKSSNNLQYQNYLTN